ncbi:RNA polymerase sigma factor [Microbacterium trichothecenolyticum]|uniref:RNA polymerase sigma factor n=1 Tax=Microbacterium trichothecenolyticum TaxID=69370 RepID=UPI00358E5021
MSEATTREERATTVVRTNGPDLRRYFLRRDTVDHHDLLHETFAVIWRRREHLPIEATAARMWSFGVARNILRRHQRRRRTHDLAVESAVRTAEVGLPADPADLVEAAERHAAIRFALRRMSAQDREIITLVHWDGFTLTEAAALLRLNPSTARTRYARAKGRLAARLTRDDHSPAG